jgi:MFS family permease
MALSGALLNGVAQGAIYVALALYAGAIGLGAGAVGALVAACTLGGMAMQFPLGLLSDRIDRRFVITGAATGSVSVALGLAALGDTPQELWIVYLGVGLLGGLTLPIYPLCAAHMNDHLRASQIVAASGTLVLVLYVGITVGPTVGAIAVRELGPTGFFLLLAGLQGLTAGTAVFRFWKGCDLATEQGHAVAMTQHATPLVAQLNPDSTDLPNAPNSAAGHQHL